jgi:hypothetical protein
MTIVLYCETLDAIAVVHDHGGDLYGWEADDFIIEILRLETHATLQTPAYKRDWVFLGEL